MMTGAVRLTLVTAKLETRDLASLLLPLGLPILIMLMNGIGAGGRAPSAELSGQSSLEAIAIPVSLTMILGMLGMIYLATGLAHYRDLGVLRRLSVTPVNPAMMLVAHLVIHVAEAAIGMAIALTIAFLLFGISGPVALGWTLVAFGLALCALFSVGLLVAALAPSANAAVAVGLVLFFSTMALGGGMVPAEYLPTWLATIGEFTPYGAALHAIRDGWVGEQPETLHMAVMAVTAVVATLVAIRTFRWE